MSAKTRSNKRIYRKNQSKLFTKIPYLGNLSEGKKMQKFDSFKIQSKLHYRRHVFKQTKLQHKY